MQADGDAPVIFDADLEVDNDWSAEDWGFWVEEALVRFRKPSCSLFYDAASPSCVKAVLLS